MSKDSPRALPEKASLDQLRKQAKELRTAQKLESLAKAQFELAKSYGFESWPKLVLELRQRELKHLIHEGDNAKLREFLAKHPKLANTPYDDRSTPLHQAAEYNDPEAIEILVEAGAELRPKHGSSAHTALSWAITCWSPHAAVKLVQLGDTPDLFCAAGMGLIDVVKQFWQEGKLIPGASRTGSSRFAESGERLPLDQSDAEVVSDALYIACRNGRLEVAKWLLDHGADPNWRAFIGATPLHWAEFTQNPELCVLLRGRGARDDIHDEEFRATPRQFPAMTLAGWGFTEPLERYLRSHPDAVKTTTPVGTPLHAASAAGHSASVQILLAHGADRDARNEAGLRPIELARSAGHRKVEEALEPS